MKPSLETGTANGTYTLARPVRFDLEEVSAVSYSKDYFLVQRALGPPPLPRNRAERRARRKSP